MTVSSRRIRAFVLEDFRTPTFRPLLRRDRDVLPLIREITSLLVADDSPFLGRLDPTNIWVRDLLRAVVNPREHTMVTVDGEYKGLRSHRGAVLSEHDRGGELVRLFSNSIIPRVGVLTKDRNTPRVDFRNFILLGVQKIRETDPIFIAKRVVQNPFKVWSADGPTFVSQSYGSLVPRLAMKFGSDMYVLLRAAVERMNDELQMLAGKTHVATKANSHTLEGRWEATFEVSLSCPIRGEYDRASLPGSNEDRVYELRKHLSIYRWLLRLADIAILTGGYGVCDLETNLTTPVWLTGQDRVFRITVNSR